MTVCDTRTGEMSEQLSDADARKLTDQIKTLAEAVQESLDKLGNLIAAAYTQDAWSALGYGSWDEYVAAEFGTQRLRLDRDERQALVVQLRSAGMSTRAIGSGIGSSEATVRRDLDASASDDADEQTGTEPVKSLDGRQRPASRPAPQYEPSGPDEFAADEEEIVEAEIVDEKPASEPRRPRTDVTFTVNRALSKLDDAADEAEKITRAHLASRKEEATAWNRRLQPALQKVQRFADFIKEYSSEEE